MGAVTAAGVFQRLITEPDARPLAGPLAQIHPAELSAYASVICSRLLARRFATPDDVRIAPWARRVAAGVPCEALDRLIRVSLGRTAELRLLPPGEITGLQIYLIRELVHEAALSARQVEELLTAAGPLARQAAHLIQHNLVRGETPS